jgi:hypothetical protein
VKNTCMPEDLTNYRFKYQEFLPVTDLNYRQPLKDKIERIEMLKRRKIVEIPGNNDRPLTANHHKLLMANLYCFTDT